MPYIIDGCNLLWAIQADDERFEPIDQYQLCWTISRFLGQCGEQGRLIFDGSGPPDKQRLDNVHHLEVRYAGDHTDTDTVIEEIIRASDNPKDLIVVSSDRRLRRAAQYRRARALRAEAFWEAVLKQMHKKKSTREPYSKRHGLSESEAEHWLDVFKIDSPLDEI